MSKYVPDVLSRRWVIISESRVARPEDTFQGQKKIKSCPFCPGNETRSGSEVYRIGEGEKDKPGWKVRVIPNKYPITDFHEVIIHSPDDDKDIEELPIEHVEEIFTAYRDRYNYYRKMGQIIIFSNHGEHAGASLKHPHSQLVVLPFQINMDILSREPLSNIIDENRFFHVYCPDFSQWPYEVWIAPKNESTEFGDITEEEIEDLSSILQIILKRLHKIYDKHKIGHLPFGYNFYIHPKQNWFIRIIPRFVHRAGFELGTGLSVNIIDPTDAAAAFKGIEEKVGKVLKKLQNHLK